MNLSIEIYQEPVLPELIKQSIRQAVFIYRDEWPQAEFKWLLIGW